MKNPVIRVKPMPISICLEVVIDPPPGTAFDDPRLRRKQIARSLVKVLNARAPEARSELANGDFGANPQETGPIKFSFRNDLL